jgi:hypothetical protein
MSSIPLLTFLKILTCSEIPVRRYPVRADKTDVSSRAARAERTISLARHTALIEESDRFEASRCDTRVSRDTSSCSLDPVGEAAGETEARLLFRGEFDMLIDP